MTTEQIYVGVVFFLFGFMVTSFLLYLYTQCIQLYELSIQLYELKRKTRIAMHNMMATIDSDIENNIDSDSE